MVKKKDFKYKASNGTTFLATIAIIISLIAISLGGFGATVSGPVGPQGERGLPGPGEGDGHSLDSVDGSYSDIIFINEKGSVKIGNNQPISDGLFSIAMGWNTKAEGFASTAMGYLSQAIGNQSIAGGVESKAFGRESVALGRSVNAYGNFSIAMGSYSKALGTHSTAIGHYTLANDIHAVAIGYNTTAEGHGTAMGANTIAGGWASTALGYQTRAMGKYSTAIGYETNSSGVYSTAMGYKTLAKGDRSTAIGTGIWVEGDDSIGIGLKERVPIYDVTSDNVMAVMGGNLGLNTSNPQTTLHVNGPITIYPSVEPEAPSYGFVLYVDPSTGYLNAKAYTGTVTVLANP